MRRVAEFHAQQRSGAVELLGRQAAEQVGHRQVELLDGEQRGVVERDQRPAFAHEVAQRLGAGLAEAARVLAGNGARGEAFHDRPLA